MDNINQLFTGPYSLILLSAGVVGTALVGYFVGDNKQKQQQQQQQQQHQQQQQMYELDAMSHHQMQQQQQQQHLHHSHHQPSGGHPGLTQQQEAEAEHRLQVMMSNLSTMMASRNLEGAERLGEEILSFTEQVWGSDHLNYGLLLGIPLANIYQMRDNTRKHEDALRRAYNILEPHGSEYVVDTGIVDRLMEIYTTGNEHKKNIKYAQVLVKARRDALKQNPTAHQLAEAFCSGALKAAYALANAGSFKQAEALYEEAIKVITNADPTHSIAANAFEFYTNALHQQGKTREAIVKLEEYRRKIMTLSILPPAQHQHHQQQPAEVTQKVLHRCATLLFTIDDFAGTLNYLNDLVQMSKEKKLPISLQMWCDLATVQWELQHDTEASETQSTMKTVPLNKNHPALPLTRSKYLYTTDCSIMDGVYSLTMRVNRERPQRKEGEEVEQSDQIKRKIEQCFLEITFEATQPNGEPVTITQVVDKPFQFVIKSPKMPQPEPFKLHEVCIVIYKDETKTTQLGTHHQLVCSYPQRL